MPSKTGTIPDIGKVRLDLDLRKSQNNILAVAVLTNDRDKTAMHGETLVFKLGDNEVFRDETDPEGTVSYNFSVSNYGEYLLSVYLANFPGIRVVYKDTLQILSTPEIKNPTIEIIGDEGLYKIIIVVYYENERPAENFPVLIVVNPVGKPPYEIRDKTNKYGCFTKNLNFLDKDQDFTVFVGPHTKEFKNFYGPPKNPRPPDVPEPPSEEINYLKQRLRRAKTILKPVEYIKGLFIAAKSGWEVGGVYKENQRRRR